MIYVYGDDGGDEKRERVTAIGVVAGLEDSWRDAEGKWIELCQGIPFHAKDCESDHGDYEGRNHQDNKAMYRKLATLLAESELGGVGVAIDLAIQKKIFPNSLYPYEQVSYHRALLEAMMRIGALAEGTGEVAKMTFDISTDYAFNAGLMYEVIRTGEPELLKWLHPEISFVSAKESPRVQMADLLTYEAWKSLDHTVGPVKRHRGSWQALRDTKRFQSLSFGEQWFLDLRKDIESGNLERKINFNEGDYHQWLKEKGRQSNMSNMIYFIDWIRKRDDKQGIREV